MIRDPLTDDTIAPLLRDLRIKWQVHAYDSVISTNDTAKNLALQGAKEGTLVVAETQSGGYGRRANVWESPEGGLWFSFVLRPHLPPGRASGLSIVAAVALARTTNDLFDIGARIKWPNDVFVAGRKLAGAMVLSAGEGVAVVGVGVNVNVPREHLPDPGWYEATSILQESGGEVSRAELLAHFLSGFESRYFAYRSPDHAQLISEWRELSLVIGESVSATVQDETVRGTVFGLEDDGGIVLRLADGSHRKLLPTGDVTLTVERG